MIRKSDIRKLASKTAAVLFVFVYASSLFLAQFHQLTHQAQTAEVICYEEDNACHLRLVHQDVENGCDHESHFSDEQSSCELCPMLQAKTETGEQNWRLAFVNFSTVVLFGELGPAEYQNYNFHYTGRAPPTHS